MHIIFENKLKFHFYVRVQLDRPIIFSQYLNDHPPRHPDGEPHTMRIQGTSDHIYQDEWTKIKKTQLTGFPLYAPSTV